MKEEAGSSGSRRLVWWTKDIAEAFGIAEAAVRMHIYKGTGLIPPPRRAGRRPYWLPDEVRDYLHKSGGEGEGRASEAQAPRRRRGRPRKEEEARK